MLGELFGYESLIFVCIKLKNVMKNKIMIENVCVLVEKTWSFFRFQMRGKEFHRFIKIEELDMIGRWEKG